MERLCKEAHRVMDATWIHALVAGVAAAVPLLIYMAKFNQKVVEQIAELKSDHKHLDKCFHRLERTMESQFAHLNKRMDKWDD